LFADARPVVAHVALHHDFPVFVQLGHAEGTGDDAVAAGDAAWLARRLHDAVAGALDRVGRTDLRAGRLFAVHAYDRNGLNAFPAVDVLQVDHRIAAMRVALRAGLHTCLTADAAARVDEEVQVVRLGHALLLRLEFRGVVRRAVRLPDAASTNLVLRDLADRILGGDGQLVRTLSPRPVVRDEKRVRPDRRDGHGAQGDGSAPGLRGRPIAIGDAELGREPWMYLDPRFRVLAHQRPDAAGLRP